ncbi:MAG: hypothetical protein WCU88_09750 [Elusimicrobiota bacterium]|jgi:hypothetical protein
MSLGTAGLRFSSRRGVALAQVLVICAVLMVLASGLIRMIFQNYQALYRTRKSDRARYILEACMVKKFTEWNNLSASGSPPHPGDKCPDETGCTGIDGKDVTVDCETDELAVRFKVTIDE